MTNNNFLSKDWQIAHLKKIKERAGNRYTPKLNIDLPIAEIFDGISRTENFYNTIRKHYGKLSREVSRISSKYENKEIQEIYGTLQDEISQLSKLLDALKKYNEGKIPWIEINEKTQKVKEIIWKLLNKLREEKDKPEKQKVDEKRNDHRSNSEKYSYDIHHLYETQRELGYFEELSSGIKSKLSNSPFLLLKGVAGTGKTHLLCDVIESRISRNNLFPAVLVFGELLATSSDPFAQIIQQLDLHISKNKFLKLLDSAGKQSGCRAIVAIDALNETKQMGFWKINLSGVVDEIKKYPNIALVVSVRTGFEGEVITKELGEDLIHEEHRGFIFREWEAVSKFFKEFNLPLPEIPLLMPEFQNPLFLLLFCKAFQDRAKKNLGKKQKQVFRGHEGATYIFESFVDNVSKRISNQFNIGNGPGKNIWDTVIEKIAAEMVSQSDDRISEELVVSLVKSVHQTIDHATFIKELERNLLLVKVPRYSIEKKEYDGFDFRFPFQKFSDHLIGRYLFKKYEVEFGKLNKNLKTAKIFFSKRRKLGKFLSNSWNNRGIVEALSIQSPEHLKGYELIDIAPYLRNSHDAQEAFVESLIWRKPTAFSADLKNTLAYVNTRIIRTESGHKNILNAFLAVATVPGHPFNADFLHKHLSKFTMAKRDSWWSTFLHYQLGEKGAVDRLIEWAWSEQDKAHIDDEAIRLCAVALCWFLTTPNRFLRDKTTKALVALLAGRLNVLLALLKQFKDVNDPYIAERLYAVGYGCAIRSEKDKEGLKALSEWVYNNIFKNGNPPVHILLRDYARGVIEVALHKKINLNVSRKKFEPPYRSQFPKYFASNSAIKKYEFNYKDTNFKDYFWAQNSIISSMQPEYGEISMYGNFGRYTFQRALSHFKYPKNMTMQKLSNWATKRVFDLGYNVNLHGNFDRNLDKYHNSEQSEHKSERIGKKYQWIALHEILARIADNCELKKERWSEYVGKYVGAWQLSVRDIDPSCILKEFPNAKPEGIPNFNDYNKQGQYNVWNKKASHSAWLKKTQCLPDPKQIIEFIDDQKNLWVALEGFIEWQEEIPPEYEKYNLPTRTLWYMVKSYLLKDSDKDKVFKWAKQQHFMGRWMPESHEFYGVYLGEYPWAPAFLPYHHRDGWTDKANGKKIPAKIIVTDDQYLSSGSSIDCSTNGSISINLPAKFIIDKMNLVQSYADGRFFDGKGDLVAFDPTAFDENLPRHVFMRKDKLCDFLKDTGCAIFWTFLGEKNMIGGGVMGQPLGWLEIDGAYTLNDNNEMIGKKRCKFKKPKS